MRKIVLVLLLVHNFLFIQAQQNIGIRNSNYAGIQAALLNPGAIADSKLKWDVNVLSLGTVFDNNFLYIPKGTIPVLGFRSIINGIKHEDKFYTRFDPGNPDKRYNFTLSGEMLGPSFHAKIGRSQVIGFTLVSRSYATINDFTGHLAQSAFDYLRNKDLWNKTFTDDKTRINGMNWLEYGFHYARVIWKNGNREVTGGISLKYLQGVAAAYVKNTSLTYRVSDTTQLLFAHSNLDYGRTDYDSYRKIKNYQDLNHGHGLGGDIGIIYERLRETAAAAPVSKKWYEPEESKYVYRLGLSFIDVGAINFNRMSAAYHLQADSANFANWHNADFTNNLQVDHTLSSVFYQGDSARSLQSDHFRMGLPTAISIQADWNFHKGFFANASIVRGFGHGSRQGIVRPDIYSLAVRYESKWLEASIPVSLIYYGNWRPRIGFAVRTGYFFFGGDALGGLLGLHDLQAVDFYAGIHFFITR